MHGRVDLLSQLLEHGDPAKPAIVVPDGPSLTYAALRERMERHAGLLRAAGIAPGQMVSLVQPNDLSCVEAFLAVTRLGAIAAPLNPAYTAEEHHVLMADAGARWAIADASLPAAWEAVQGLGMRAIASKQDAQGLALDLGGVALSLVADAPLPQPGDVALFLHTSGTTSRPKGVPLTHANIGVSAGNTARTYALMPDDVTLAVMPLFHVHGLVGVVLSTLLSGGTVVLPPRFSASGFWPVAARYRATWYSSSPTIHQVLLMRADQDNAPRGAFRFVRSCSAALAPAVLEQYEARFDVPVVEAYGMTEAAHQIASNPLPPGARPAGSVGRGTGVEIAVLDDRGNPVAAGAPGEVCLRGPNVMHGYRDNPQANAASFVSGWFRTGDQGVLSADGYVTLTGRLKELINRGGEKIAPLEVDAVLARHPAVAEAICFGVPDVKYGEEVHAAVVLRGDATAADIQAFCRGHLAEFKVPKVVHIATELPRTATGKVQRRHVAALFGQGLSQ